MSNKGVGLEHMINDCNTIIVTEEAKQKALEKFREDYSKRKEEPVIYISEEMHKHLEEYYDRWRLHEEEIKNFYNRRR